MLEQFGMEAVSLGLITGLEVCLRRMGAVSEDDVASSFVARPRERVPRDGVRTTSTGCVPYSSFRRDKPSVMTRLRS